MNRRRFLTVALLALPSAVALGAAPTTRPARPLPEVERVLIVSIDGLRPDVFLRANAPNMRSLMENGAFTFWAKTTAVAITLPSHVSMLTGVVPVRHGIQWNENLPLATPYYTKVPTIFSLAHDAGYSTAMVAAKSKFGQIPKPGSVDWLRVPISSEAEKAKEAAKTMEEQAALKTRFDNRDVADFTMRILHDHRPEVLFVHFGSVDSIGHSKGWGSPEQLASLAEIDECMGRIIGAYEALGLMEHTVFIITADHGGAGKSHGADDIHSRTIPWIISGPGVRKNYDLTRESNLQVNTYDTFATACYLLGLKVSSSSDGKPILEAFEKPRKK